MYQAVKIRDFRLFADFEIKDLQLVNLISGPAGTGKTSFLEALYIQRSICNKPQYQIPSILDLAHFRGENIISFSEYFPDGCREKEIQFVVEGPDRREQTILCYDDNFKDLRRVGKTLNCLPEELLRVEQSWETASPEGENGGPDLCRGYPHRFDRWHPTQLRFLPAFLHQSLVIFLGNRDNN